MANTFLWFECIQNRIPFIIQSYFQLHDLILQCDIGDIYNDFWMSFDPKELFIRSSSQLLTFKSISPPKSFKEKGTIPSCGAIQKSGMVFKSFFKQKFVCTPLNSALSVGTMETFPLIICVCMLMLIMLVPCRSSPRKI